MTLPPSMLERRFKPLVGQIHRGECVLVLGPGVPTPSELTDGEPESLESWCARRVLEALGVGAPSTVTLRAAVAHYERERKAFECRSVVQDQFAQLDKLCTDLHRDLATLPFRLVLSAAPDRMFAYALRARGKKVQEACYNYPRGVSAQTALTAPGADAPIVYSLFGRHDHPESMVLDDKNLLDYLVRVVKESPALPDAVRATLRAPSTVFFFIGFGFTNWWLRLLLKVLEVTGVENRGLSLALEDQSSFDAVQHAESKGFYDAAGIYIQTRNDWGALANHLAKTFVSTAPVDGLQQPPANQQFSQSPLIFLSYASEDASAVEGVRARLEMHGLRVWLDKQNLRNGQNWKHQIDRIIGTVDYFVFVQSPRMDERDRLGQDGVYNWELKKALERQSMRPEGAVFVLHTWLGECAPRPELELEQLHRCAIDTETGIDKLANDIMSIHHHPRAHALPRVG